jgi:hypothetical protein
MGWVSGIGSIGRICLENPTSCFHREKKPFLSTAAFGIGNPQNAVN